jgi:hypothetical protein
MVCRCQEGSLRSQHGGGGIWQRALDACVVCTGNAGGLLCTETVMAPISDWHMHVLMYLTHSHTPAENR